MKIRRLTAGPAAVALSGTAEVAAAPTQAADRGHGTRSIASVLAADGHRVDSKLSDFDVLNGAAGAVLKTYPKSPVKALADGKVPLTVFAPTDAAFERLAGKPTGQHITSERRAFGVRPTSARARRSLFRVASRVRLLRLAPARERSKAPPFPEGPVMR